MRFDESVLLRKLTRREFRERMNAGELQAAILVVGAVEQHLEHMALEHDYRSGLLIAGRVAEALQPQVLVADPLMAGISEHHMSHPGTLTLQPSTFLAVLSDILDSLLRAGFRNVLVLNAHGGNVLPVQAIWDQMLRKYQANLWFLPYWDLCDDSDRALLTSGSLPGHAQEFETAFGLAEFPENVRTEMWRDQEDQTPSLATAEQGRELVERIVSRVTDYLREMLDGKRVAVIPDFFP